MAISNPHQTSVLEMKKKHIAELIRLTSLQSEQLDPILPVMIHQAASVAGIQIAIEKTTKMVKERIVSEKFIARFCEIYAVIFSDEEILELLSFYKTETMRKFLRHSIKLYHPFYEAFRKIVDEVLQELSSTHNKS